MIIAGNLVFHFGENKRYHFTVVCLVTWPLNGSEATGDLVSIKSSLLLLCNSRFLMLTSWHLNEKSIEVCIKARSLPASLTVIGQVTNHTAVKWPIVKNAFGYSYMMGMVTSSYDVAAMIVTPLISYLGGSRKKPVFCAWGVFAMGVGFFIFMLPHFVSPPYEAGMFITIGRSLHRSFFKFCFIGIREKD